jgi:hypothetical protein
MWKIQQKKSYSVIKENPQKIFVICQICSIFVKWREKHSKPFHLSQKTLSFSHLIMHKKIFVVRGFQSFNTCCYFSTQFTFLLVYIHDNLQQEPRRFRIFEIQKAFQYHGYIQFYWEKIVIQMENNWTWNETIKFSGTWKKRKFNFNLLENYAFIAVSHCTKSTLKIWKFYGKSIKSMKSRFSNSWAHSWRF